MFTCVQTDRDGPLVDRGIRHRGPLALRQREGDPSVARAQLAQFQCIACGAGFGDVAFLLALPARFDHIGAWAPAS